MRRLLIAAAALCAGAALTPTTAPAQVQAGDPSVELAAAAGAGTIRPGASVNLRATPRGKRVGRLPGAKRVAITCQRNGPAASGPAGRSAIWDRIPFRATSAYVADALVRTVPAGALVAPFCNAPPPLQAPNPGTTAGSCPLIAPVTLEDPFTDHGAFIKAAIPGAQQSQRETEVPASVTIAQAILESGFGASAAGANNYFGIKAQSAQSASGRFDWGTIAVGCVLKKTQEVAGGRYHTEIGAFRAYLSLEDSIRDHGQRLRLNPVYAAAFDHTDDAKRFARIIARHYATDPAYADKVVELMGRFKLQHYDVGADELATGSGGAQAG